MYLCVWVKKTTAKNKLVRSAPEYYCIQGYSHFLPFMVSLDLSPLPTLYTPVLWDAILSLNLQLS